MERIQKSVKKPTLTPLGIISIFFSFTEVALGYAVFNTQGTIQITLTIFVIAFPTFVAIMFFIMLWHKPLYLWWLKPSDFEDEKMWERCYREGNFSDLSQNHSISPTMNEDKFKS